MGVRVEKNGRKIIRRKFGFVTEETLRESMTGVGRNPQDKTRGTCKTRLRLHCSFWVRNTELIRELQSPSLNK